MTLCEGLVHEGSSCKEALPELSEVVICEETRPVDGAVRGPGAGEPLGEGVRRRGQGLQIASWNVAGWGPAVRKIRAHHSSLKAWLDGHCIDVLCIQEVKLPPDKVAEGFAELGALMPGWDSYWACPRGRARPVAGVAAFLREGLARGADAAPLRHEELDAEGRCLLLDLGREVIFNVYVPNPGPLLQRLPFTMHFLRTLQERMREVRTGGRTVILLGDLNIIRRPCDMPWPERHVCLDSLCSGPEGDQVWEQALMEAWVAILRPALSAMQVVPMPVSERMGRSGRGSGSGPPPQRWAVKCKVQHSGAVTEIRSEFARCWAASFESADEARGAFDPEEWTVGAEGGRERFLVRSANTLQVRRLMALCDVLLTGALREKLVACGGQAPWERLADRCGASRTPVALRDWLDGLLTHDGMVDSFASLYPRALGRYTIWDQYLNERFVNSGARIDYILLDHPLIKQTSVGTGLVLGSRFPPRHDFRGMNLPQPFMKLHAHRVPEEEGCADSSREALLALTANGNWTPAPLTGGGLEACGPNEDAMQFREGPGSGMIYTPPNYSDHIPVALFLRTALQQEWPAQPLVPADATGRAQPQHRLRTLHALCARQRGQQQQQAKELGGQTSQASIQSQWRGNILTSQMIPLASAPNEGKELAPAKAEASAGCLLASETVIAAIDLDCFYAQCEEIRHPELRGRPVGVQQKMLIITSNYAARAFGIKKGESLASVRQKCPDITICNGEDLAFYREVSQNISDFAARWSPLVERLGMDEVFLDITELVAERLAEHRALGTFTLCCSGFVYPNSEQGGAEKNFQASTLDKLSKEESCWLRLAIASQIVSEMRAALYAELGLTVSAGVSVSKLLAKLVSSEHKPGMQTVLHPSASALRALLPDALPIQKIPGIGFSCTRRWNELGVFTLGDLQEATAGLQEPNCRPPPPEVVRAFDVKTLRTQRALCLGICEEKVIPSGPPKSASTEDSFWQQPLSTDSRVSENLQQLARRLLIKVRGDEARFGCRPLLTLAVAVRHVEKAGTNPGTSQLAGKRERRQMRLEGAGLRIEQPPAQCPPREPSQLSQADQLRAEQMADRAFGLFRKLVPHEPYALTILNLHVQYGETLAPAQSSLKFSPAAVTSPMRPALDAAGASGTLGHLKPEGLVAAEAVPVDDDDEELTTMPSEGRDAGVDSNIAVTTLLGMGFSRVAAMQALAACGGSLPGAVERLLASPKGMPVAGATDTHRSQTVGSPAGTPAAAAAPLAGTKRKAASIGDMLRSQPAVRESQGVARTGLEDVGCADTVVID